MILPIRIKLTALYTSVVILSFVSFFWVSDLGFQHSIETTVNDASRTNLQIIARLLQNQTGRSEVDVRAKLQEISELWANGAIFEVANGKGEWIHRSTNFEYAHPALPRGDEPQIAFFTTTLESLQYRVALQRVETADRVFEIHAAVPTEPFDQALDNFRLIEK